MPPSRRRGPSGKTSATAARSAAIQAAEKRRREEQDHIAACMSTSNNNNNKTNVAGASSNHGGNNNNNNNKMNNKQSEDIHNRNYSTAKGVGDDNSKNYTSIATNETGKKRKKFSLLPPFAANIGTNMKATTTKSTASSSLPSPSVIVTTSKQVPHAQPYCKLVNEDSQQQQQRRQGKAVYKRKEDIVQDCGDDDDNEEDEDDDDVDNDDGCLHCHQKVKNMPRIRVIDDDDDNNNNDGDSNNTDDDDDDDENNTHGCGNIQVRCDDCRRYICNGCHWCHEFQANHEIRVCDRCDAFYCRGCDEMDQCDDCGEVVCGSCSTLLSCKFCGGGLCEECATACGRCGIVLCSRDAKFAVDCDTCRLSYCLVCLASGSKDPCVRCGHRPSKRMEQLVHLRLKSIYKAFKSSSNSNSSGALNNSPNSNHNSSTANSTKASNSSGGGSSIDSNMNRSFIDIHGNNSSGKNKNGHGGRSRRNKPTTLQDMVGDHDDEGGGTDPTMSMMMGAAAGVLPHKFCHDLEQNYMAEQEKADAAAKALLAELEEEEEAKAQKESKKKKKKERKNASKQQQYQNDDDDNDDEFLTRHLTKVQNGYIDTASLDSGDEMDTDLLSETDSTAYKNMGTEIDEVQKDEMEKIDPIEKELVEYVNDFNLEGIRDILIRLKGVPGRAALRKNAKKALKRLKLELDPPLPAPPESEVDESSRSNEKKSVTSTTRSSSMSGKAPALAAETRSTTKKTSSKSAGSPDKSNFTSTKSSHPKSSSHKNNVNNRSEAVVEIVSRLVGWMIGKNGQRIRDLMEESGAKIWIDQEKFKGQETRNVYVSGDRKSVDQAVLLVKDVIINAPPPQGSSITAAATVAMDNLALSPKSLDTVASCTTDYPSVLAAASGTIKVKSVWAKISESNAGVDASVPGTIPKPPALISASASVPDRVKEHVEDQTASESAIESTNNEEAGESSMNDITQQNSNHESFLVDVVNPAVTASVIVNSKHIPGETTTEIVACEARFVPLLIGKRGWTIKHIQDDSGARVDINQTVTPRQVRISGSKTNVDKAVTMVRDVLSYPHAQLQSSEEMDDDECGGLPVLKSDIEHFEEPDPISTPTKEKLLAASAVLEHDAAKETIPRLAENIDRIQSPPPMVGDAKSAISASSSLSSTPEPSMASSSKGFIASHLQNGPLLPPAIEQYNSERNPSQPAPRPFLQPEIAMTDAVGVRGLWPSSGGSGPRVAIAPQQLYVDNVGQIGMQGGGRMVMPQIPGRHSQLQQQLHQQQSQLMYSHGGKPAPQMNNGVMHDQHHSQNNHSHRQQQIPQSFGPTSQVSHRMPMSQSSQFNNQNIRNSIQSRNIPSASSGSAPYNLYSNEGLPAARAIATTPLRDLMPHAGGGNGASTASSPMRASGFREGVSRLWNSGNPSYSSSGLPSQTSGLQPRSSSGYSTASLGFSSQHQQLNETGTGISNQLGYNPSQGLSTQQPLRNLNSVPVGGSIATTFPGSTPSGQRNEDSRMIDSLFGGTIGVQSSNIAASNSLLTGFNTMTLPSESDGTKSSGLWGSSALTEGWCQNEGSGVNDSDAAAPNVSSIGNIFSNKMPNSQDRPQESRFSWNPTNANH
mmetsp:Transcript_16666/g.18766  ORF Transcript_16666/g.18766 Transcript_16666/m.18766 type:complete len:1600 (+) Transcript_16666:248-5047(+)